MQKYKYLAGYGNELLKQVDHLIEHKKLSSYFQKKYKKAHDFSSDRALYDYTLSLKDQYLRKSNPLSKVIYDNKINVMKHALGLHTFISRVQGKKLKAKHEIRIASIFKNAPEPFLKMIVVHELAHLKEKEHNKAFYKLCQHMEPSYHQLEFDLRLYLTHIDLFGPLY